MFWGKIKEMSRIVRELPPDGINVPDGRVRRITYDDGLRSLADSIRDHGVIEPLIVRRIQSGEGEVTYTLVAGARRLRAAKLAGLTTVPCVTVDAGEEEAAAIAIIENLHREDLNIFEEASAIASLIAVAGLTQEICQRMNTRTLTHKCHKNDNICKRDQNGVQHDLGKHPLYQNTYGNNRENIDQNTPHQSVRRFFVAEVADQNKYHLQ